MAYPASESDLDREKLPKDLVQAAAQIIKHWKLPIPTAEMKKLEEVRRELSQAAHGRVRALESLDGWAADWLPRVKDFSEMLMELVEEADRRLNSHRN